MSRVIKLCILLLNIFIFLFMISYLDRKIDYSSIYFPILFTLTVYLFGGLEKENIFRKYEFYLKFFLSYLISSLLFVGFQFIYLGTIDLIYTAYFGMYTIFILPISLLLVYQYVFPSLKKTKILCIYKNDISNYYVKRIADHFFHKVEIIYSPEPISQDTLTEQFIIQNQVNLILIDQPTDASHKLSKQFQIPLQSIGFLSENYLRILPLALIHLNVSYYINSFEARGIDPIIRLLDIFISIFIIILIMPIFLFFMMILFFIQHGQILFKQNRVGYNGMNFTMLKLSTLYYDASSQTLKPTILGAFLRKTRMNELPQLWNVLKGDMSLVGPRPDLVDQYSILSDAIPFYHYRLNALPGITGHAQVYSDYIEMNNIQQASKRLEYDLFYVKNYSVYLYLMTLVKSVAAVLSFKGK